MEFSKRKIITNTWGVMKNHLGLWIFIMFLIIALNLLLSNIQEVKSRGGKLLSISSIDTKDLRDLADDFIFLEGASEIHNSLTPILTSIPLQLLAYHIAVLKGCNVDQPRNLAKSVTVE